MDKKITSKLQLFFIGLENRFEEQEDFFIGMEFKFKSGGKEFLGSYEEESLYFKNEYTDINLKASLEVILKEALNYEALELKYFERGTTVVIEADGKNVKTRYEEPKKTLDVKVESKRDYFIKASKAPELLKEIGIMTKDGKIKNDMIRKYNQIDHFIEVVEPILKDLDGKDTITIMDCACGKSYLTFVLNYYIKEVMKKNCYFIGIDYQDQVIKSSKERAERLGYKNMEFIKEDLKIYMPDRKIDMVVSLHACDIATDFAIAAGIRAKAKSLVVVPCCHKELIDQIDSKELKPLYKHNIFRAKLNDTLTDSLRCLFIEAHGYEVSPLEYISPLDTPKNLMIRAIKTQEENFVAREEYESIKKIFKVKPSVEYYVY